MFARQHNDAVHFPGRCKHPPGDAAALATTLRRVALDAVAREAAVRRLADFTRGFAWEEEAPRYLAVVERLARRR